MVSYSMTMVYDGVTRFRGLDHNVGRIRHHLARVWLQFRGRDVTGGCSAGVCVCLSILSAVGMYLRLFPLFTGRTWPVGYRLVCNRPVLHTCMFNQK